MKHGFIYIWFDRKRKMFYIGSHWGTEDDGYICSSTRMRNAYRRRPEDFKRRILTRIHSSRIDLLNEEQRWFDMVKRKDRYYNMRFDVKYQVSWADPNNQLRVAEKISKANKKYWESLTEEERERHIAARNNRRKHTPEEIEKRVSKIRGQPCSEAKKKKIGAANSNTYSFLSPSGEVHVVSNIKEFSAAHGLGATQMRNLYNGKYNPYKGQYSSSYKGWSKAH